MEKAGLYSAPKFDDFQYYLGEGELTKQTDLIKNIAKFEIKSNTDEEKIRTLMGWMNKNVIRKNEYDPQKFNKTADEILSSRQRTGCSDGAVLFSTIARAMNIPAMQVITYDKDWAEEIRKGEKPKVTRGHFFTAVYIKINGMFSWVLVDTDQPATENNQVKLFKMGNSRRNNRNISKRRYAFAYVRDFRDFSVDGVVIDSASSMRYIQTKAALESNVKDIEDMDEVR